ncbi:Glycogen synthase [Dirofilaria immitis]|nr:hypothetical protein [Dirofilaria immitis]
MHSKNAIPASDFLSSKETYEKYEKSHGRNFSFVPISVSTVTPVTYLNEYKVVTRTPVPQNDTMVSMPYDESTSEQVVQSSVQRRIPFGRVLAATIAIPLFVMLCLFIAIWFQELGFI